MRRKNFNRNRHIRRRFLDLQYRLDNGLINENGVVFALTRQKITGRFTIIKCYENIAFEITTNNDFWKTHIVIDTYPKNYLVIPAYTVYGSGAIAIEKEIFKNMLLSEYRRY